MTEMALSRFRQALRGGAPPSPAVAGLTFASAEVLASLDPGSKSVADGLLSAARSLALDFVFVPASAPWAKEVCERREDLAVLWAVDGPLWPVLSAAPSVAEGLRLTLRDPASLTARLDGETFRAKAEATRGAELGVDAVVIADDLGGSAGLLVTPEFARLEVLPRFAAIAAVAPGVPVLLHSDGDVRALLPDLRALGFAGLHSGGLSREDFESVFWEARRHRLAVMGGIPSAVLSRGTVAAIQTGTRIALLAQAGGLLVADDGGISRSDEIDAFSAAVGAARGFSASPARA